MGGSDGSFVMGDAGASEKAVVGIAVRSLRDGATLRGERRRSGARKRGVGREKSDTTRKAGGLMSVVGSKPIKVTQFDL